MRQSQEVAGTAHASNLAVVEEIRQRHEEELQSLTQKVLEERTLVVASNRGPVSFQVTPTGELEAERGTGGVITALSAISHHANPIWVAAAMTEGDRQQAEQREGGYLQWSTEGHRFRLSFVVPPEQAYDWYYNRISNPLLWFLQHNLWDAPRTPTIDTETWRAWHEGYEAVNRLFAERIAQEVVDAEKPLVMLHDYHLYRCAAFLRPLLGKKAFLHHFVHIPWPGPGHWTMLPPTMREGIFRSLCANDVVGFQTQTDALNFVRTCERYLPEVEADVGRGRIDIEGHTAWIRPYPISIDTLDLTRLAQSDQVRRYRRMLEGYTRDKTIVRVDRVEPSKNILRGFQALELLLREHPDYQGRLKFLAFLVPSRLGIEQYQQYLTEISGAAMWINAEYGTGDWNPIELFVGENYPRAVAGMQLYDVLLVNPIVDGMNLISKEGPTVNERNGVLVLSDGAGSFEQLHDEAMTVSPYDVVDTAEAMHKALQMDDPERRRRSERIRQKVAEEDLSTWLAPQLQDIDRLEREQALD